jgi:hypothetical protein
MTLLVRDNEDILGANLDFHLSRGVDHFLVMDNRSVDATADIVRRYERRGLATYLFQPEDNYSQSAWVTQMARRASGELNADWVINNDADEFWWPDEGDLKAALAAVPASAQGVVVERTNFVPPPAGSGEAGAPFFEMMTVREASSLNALGQPLPPKLCHRGLAEVVVEMGNHGASLHGQPLTATTAAISILHFPVRGFGQLAHKITLGGAALARNKELPQEAAATWRKLHQLQAQGELRRAYDALALGEAEIAEGLASGRLIRDTRLRDALAALARA